MKNKVIYSVAILAVAVLAAINMSMNTQDHALPDVSLSDVEALAYELGEVTDSCGRQSCHTQISLQMKTGYVILIFAGIGCLFALKYNKIPLS